MLVSAERVGITKGSLYSPQPLACMQGEIHTIYAWIYAYCKAENDCVVMGDLSLLLFYFSLVTFVVSNVPISMVFIYVWKVVLLSNVFLFQLAFAWQKCFCFYWNSPQAYVLYSGYQIIDSTCDIHKRLKSPHTNTHTHNITELQCVGSCWCWVTGRKGH